MPDPEVAVPLPRVQLDQDVGGGSGGGLGLLFPVSASASVVPPFQDVLGDVFGAEAQGAQAGVGVVVVGGGEAPREEELLVVVGALEGELERGGGLLMFVIFGAKQGY